MPGDSNGISDEIQVVLNGDQTETEQPLPEDVKGPDPAVWGPDAERDEPEYDPGEGEVKGPDPAVWGPQEEE